MKQFRNLVISVVGIVVLASIVGIVWKQSGMEPNHKIDKAQAKEVQAHQKHVQKQHDDRMNESNIDYIQPGSKGYQIAHKPAQKDNEVVQPKKIKVYTVKDGHKKDITDLGDVSFQQDGNFINWTYNFGEDKDVKKDIKSILGDRIVYDITYDEKVKSNTETKEAQFVRKQKTDLERQVRDEKYSKDDKTDVGKKHKKELKNTKQWLKDANNNEAKTHRYEHELRYENDNAIGK